MFSFVALTWLSKCFSAVDLSAIQSSLPSHIQPSFSFCSSVRRAFPNVNFCLLGCCAMCVYQEPVGSVQTPLGRLMCSLVPFPPPKQQTEKFSVLLKITVWSLFWGLRTSGGLGFPVILCASLTDARALVPQSTWTRVLSPVGCPIWYSHIVALHDTVGEGPRAERRRYCLHVTSVLGTSCSIDSSFIRRFQLHFWTKCLGR